MKNGGLHLFETVNQFNSAYTGEDYEEPWVSLTEENRKVDYNKRPFEEYLTFEIISGGTLYWKKMSQTISWSGVTIEYSKDGGDTWTPIMTTTAGTPLSVNAGDVVMFRGDNSRYATMDSVYSDDSCRFSGSTGIKFNAKGNIMSLIDSKKFSKLKATTTICTFSHMFAECVGLIDASKLLLPATAISQNCYSSMFMSCTGMTAAPELPATELATSCYWRMFYGCQSLTTAPELKATTLTDNCYNMMFRDSTNLNQITCLATNILASNCLTNWVRGVASSGTFYKNPDMSTWPSGTGGIPAGWTVEDAS